MKKLLLLTLLPLMPLLASCAAAPSAGEDFIQWQTSTDPKTGIVTQIGKMANTKDNDVVGLDVDLSKGTFKIQKLTANASAPITAEGAVIENLFQQVLAKFGVPAVSATAPQK